MNKKSPTEYSSARLFTSAGNLSGRKSSSWQAFAAAALLSLAGPGQGFANDTIWDPVTMDPLWLTPENWSDGVPASASHAFFGVSAVSPIGLNFIDGDLSAGAITMSASATADLSLSTVNEGGAAGALKLYGIATTIGGTGVTLLLENLSSSVLSLSQVDTGNNDRVMTLSLENSGVINAVGQIAVNNPIVGTGGITKIGSGLLSLGSQFGGDTGASTYAGGFTLKEGTVQWASSGTAGVSSPFGLGPLILEGGTLRSDGTDTRAVYNAITFTGGTVTFGATSTYNGRLNIGSSAVVKNTTVAADTTLNVLSTTYWYELITGTGSITKTGPGVLDINSSATNNTFSGGFILDGGIVQTYGTGTAAANPFGTGPLTLKSGTLRPQTVTSGRTIYNSVILDGSVTLGRSDATTGTLTFSTGTTTVASDSTLNVPSLINWRQIISGPGGITKTGEGILDLGQTTSTSTYLGGFTLDGGTVQSYTGSSVSGGVITGSPFGLGTLTLKSGTLTAQGTTGRTYRNSVVLDGVVAFGTDTKPGGLSFQSDGGGTTTLASDSIITTYANVGWYQSISGDYGLIKAGPAYFQIGPGALASYTGTTTVLEGSFWANGILSSSPVAVLTGAIFGGIGTVSSDITVGSGGIFAPGSQTTRGTLIATGTISLASDAIFSFDLASATTYDSLAAYGAVDLGGAELQLALGYQPAEGSVFVLVDNFSLGLVTGHLTYGGLALNDGDFFEVTTGDFSQWFQIDYAWSDGGAYTDTLAVIAAAVPEPSSWAMLGLGTLALAAFSRRLRRCG